MRALDAFCTTAATRLSAELRVPLELEVIDTTQLPWSSAQSALPQDSVGAALAVSPVGTRMLLTAELPLVLLTIEHLLGGAPERPPKARKLSEIDWALTRRLFEMLTHHLSLVWQDLAGPDAGGARRRHAHGGPAGHRRVGPDADAHVRGARRPPLLDARRCSCRGSAIDAVADELAGRETRNEAADPRIAAAVRRAVAGAEVVLRAEVAHVEHGDRRGARAASPATSCASARPAEAGVGIYAEDVPIHRAQPGRSGTRRAVQVTAPGGGVA